MLLIHPPVAKPCEPPAGIARLAGALRGAGFSCTLLDANLEGQLFLLASRPKATDTWSRRADRAAAANLAELRRPELYSAPDRYRRAVADLNRVLEMAGRTHNLSLSMANYQDPAYSPLKSEDLLRAAADFRENMFFPYFAGRLPQLLGDSRHATVGISLNYLSQALPSFALAGYLRHTFPGIRLVMGGGLVTSWLRNPDWSDPFAGLIDLLVAGPGEDELLRLAGGANLPRKAPPDYSGLPLTEYLAPGLILPYAASSGCYWHRCLFCPEKAEGNPYRPLPPDQVLDDLAGLIRAATPVLLHFLDNAISPALLAALAARPPDVPWYGFARIDHNLADPAFCRDLRRAGCVMLKLGLESGSEKVLAAMDKGIDLSLVERALTALHAAGIRTYVYLLFGTPAESPTEARETLAFTVRHARAISWLNLAVFNMPLGSPEADMLQLDRFSEGDLSLYTDFVHPRGWDRKAIRRFLDQEFKRQPAIAAILRRDPPLFTSNHAPFFCGTASVTE
ncbi:MAG: B12-binding domain-containing radical SAM protein [Thermodesulfobacteriota bacterium]